jgi:hypothetical protein
VIKFYKRFNYWCVEFGRILFRKYLALYHGFLYFLKKEFLMVLFKGSKRFLFLLILVGAVGVNLLGINSNVVIAEDKLEGEIPPLVVEVVNPYFTIERITLDDGTTLEKNIINGPPEPSSEFKEARVASIEPITTNSVIADFPSYDWVFGCSAVSGAMIAAYYDRNGYPNMYTGPTNGGVMPLTDTSWPSWYSPVPDAYDPYPSNPLVASKNGVDGRTTKGSIDDYWVSYGSSADDPFIGNWVEHDWSDAIGDFMKTSQSYYGNFDGSTNFYNWKSSSDPMTCSDMKSINIDHLDGTYGRKLFYEARGYSVSSCYNQYTDNEISGGFTLSDFIAEIDSGHPVLLNLEGHSIVGYGYSGSTIYIRDTWDSNPENTYTMPWGGCLPVSSESCLDLYAVSVVRLEPISVSPSPPIGISATDGSFTDRIRISWTASDGAESYKVFRHTINSTTGAKELISGHTASPYEDDSADPDVTYFYWVQACNSAGCSDYSLPDTGYAASALTAPSDPTGVDASDGIYMDKVRISWDQTEGAAYYEVHRTAVDSPPENSDQPLADDISITRYDDFSTEENVTYYYWVKACNSTGCSNFSDSDDGWREANNVYLPLILR